MKHATTAALILVVAEQLSVQLAHRHTVTCAQMLSAQLAMTMILVVPVRKQVMQTELQVAHVKFRTMIDLKVMLTCTVKRYAQSLVRIVLLAIMTTTGPA